MHDITSLIARTFPATDFYVDLPFWGYFAAVVLLYRTAPRGAAYGEWLLLACNVGMLMALPRFGLATLAVMLGLCVVTYACATLLLAPSRPSTAGLAREVVFAGTGYQRRPNAPPPVGGGGIDPGSERPARLDQRTMLAGLGILAILLVLLFFKYGSLQQAVRGRQPAMPSGVWHPIVLIGISYSSFKAMHFVIEAHKRKLESPTFVTFLNYVLFFPSFISGPINRYNHYRQQSAQARNSSFRGDLACGLERIVHGLFKKTVLTMVLLPYTLDNLGPSIDQMPGWQLVLRLYAYAFYSYFDFSGYTDMALGSARIMGFVLPENFNHPFLKKNIQQFWANWHISLTSWLTDYIYWPMVRKLRNGEYFRRRPLLLSNVAIVVTFAVCGIWHGSSPGFVLWGLYHGVGIATVNTYQNWKRRVRHPAARAYFGSTYSRALGTVLTVSYFAAGLMPFALDFDLIRALVGRLI